MKEINKKSIHLFLAMIIFIIGIYMIGISREIETYDYWWHVKAGEYMVENASIPTRDIFSWYGISNNLEWTSHEWLSEVLLYLPYLIFGQGSGYLVASIMFIFTGVLFYLLNIKNYNKNPIFTLLWIILGVVIMMPTFNPRPHMFSFILFLITLKILFSFLEKDEYKFIYMIPIISLIWANLHGGSSNLPYILCIIMLLTGLIEKDFGFISLKKLELKKIRILFCVSILSILAISINPHGIDMILYPYLNMGDGLMLNVIQEWRAPDLKIITDSPIYILIFAIYFIFLKRIKSIDFKDLIIVLAFTYLTFKSVRFSPFLYAVSTFIIFNYIKDKEEDLKTLSIGLVLMGLLFITFNTPYILSSKNTFIDSQLVSEHIIESIKENDINKIYNAYNTGGYLIYNGIKPFIDGRADVYSKHTLGDYHLIETMTGNAKELISKYEFDGFLIEKGTAIHNYIKDNTDYKEICEDENYILYKKTLNNQCFYFIRFNISSDTYFLFTSFSTCCL